MLPGTFACKSLCGHSFSFSWMGFWRGILSFMVSVRNRQLFSKWLHHFSFPPAMFEGSNFSKASLCVGVSGSNVSNSMQPHGLQSPCLLGPWNSLGKNTGVGSHCHLQDLPDPQIQPRSLALQADSLPSEPLGKSHSLFGFWIFFFNCSYPSRHVCIFLSDWWCWAFYPVLVGHL